MELRYSDINLDNTTELELIEKLQNDYFVYQQMRAKISSLKKADKKFVFEEQNNNNVSSEIDNNSCVEIDIDEDFEGEVDYYYYMVKNVNTLDLEQNLVSSLPSRENYQYEKLLLRICAEIMNNIKFMRDLLNDEDVSKDDILAFSNDINIELEKVRIIKNMLKEDKKVCCNEQIIKNKIVFVPTFNGNMRIIEDVTKIPLDYYSRFKVLVKSIEDGTFKGAKRFYAEGLNGLCEVRFYNTRVLFCQLDKNTYGIIGAFVKKTTSDTYYNSMINNYNLLYKSSLAALISKLSDPEFMKLQDEYYKELFDILEPQSDIVKVNRI